MQTQVRIPTLPPVAPGLPEPASATGPRPPPLAEWVIGSVGFLAAARPRHLVFPFSPSAFSFFIPARLHLFLLGSAILAKPQPLAILRAHPAPREPHHCRDPPRGQSAARDPSRPRAVVPELNLPSSVGEGCCGPQPVGGAARLGRSGALLGLAAGGRCSPGRARPWWVVAEFHPAGAPPTPRFDPNPEPARANLRFPQNLTLRGQSRLSSGGLVIQRASPPAS